MVEKWWEKMKDFFYKKKNDLVSYFFSAQVWDK